MGPVEEATRRDVEQTISGHPMGDSIAELAFSLARSIDAGGLDNPASVAKELRACLTELALGVEADDDDLDDLLSAPSEVRDEED
jgi:hypothetical protein